MLCINGIGNAKMKPVVVFKLTVVVYEQIMIAFVFYIEQKSSNVSRKPMSRSYQFIDTTIIIPR